MAGQQAPPSAGTTDLSSYAPLYQYWGSEFRSSAASLLPTGISTQPETLQLEQLKADIYKETWIQISALLFLHPTPQGLWANGQSHAVKHVLQGTHGRTLRRCRVGYLASEEHDELWITRLLCSQAFFSPLGFSILLSMRRMVSLGSGWGLWPFLSKHVSRGQSKKSWQKPSESENRFKITKLLACVSRNVK